MGEADEGCSGRDKGDNMISTREIELGFDRKRYREWEEYCEEAERLEEEEEAAEREEVTIGEEKS